MRTARRVRSIALFALALAFFCAGCRTYGTIGRPRKFVRPVVAVESFQNRAPFPLRWELGNGMAEMLIAALVKSGRVTVVSRSALPSLFQELEMQRDPRFRPQGKVQRGRLKNAQYLVRGTVVDFTHAAGGGLHFFRGLARGHLRGYVALVTITVSVIDIESSEVSSETFGGKAWAASAGLQGTYKSVALGGNAFYKTPLGKATRAAIWDAVHWAVGRIGSREWMPRIARIADDRMYLSGGKDRGMRVGEELEVREPGEAILDPATGDEIGRGPDRILGRLRVIEVQDKLSIAEVVSGSAFHVGQACRRVKTPNAPNREPRTP